MSSISPISLVSLSLLHNMLYLSPWVFFLIFNDPIFFVCVYCRETSLCKLFDNDFLKVWVHQDPQPQPWIDFAINIYLLNQ